MNILHVINLKLSYKRNNHDKHAIFILISSSDLLMQVANTSANVILLYFSMKHRVSRVLFENILDIRYTFYIKSIE